jgi:hypothetical protein
VVSSRDSARYRRTTAGIGREAHTATVEIPLRPHTIVAPSHPTPPVGTNRLRWVQMRVILVQEVEPQYPVGQLALASASAGNVLCSGLAHAVGDLSGPDERCDTAVQRQEWQAVHATITTNTQVGTQPPTVHQAVRWIVHLGGFLAHTSDGEPGGTTLWWGLQCCEDLIWIWVGLHPSALPSTEGGSQEEPMRDENAPQRGKATPVRETREQQAGFRWETVGSVPRVFLSLSSWVTSLFHRSRVPLREFCTFSFSLLFSSQLLRQISSFSHTLPSSVCAPLLSFSSFSLDERICG